MKKQVAHDAPSGNGRPNAITVSPDEFDAIAANLRHSAMLLTETAKFCRENNLPDGFRLHGAKVLDEHLPAVLKFCGNAYSEAQPAATAKILGRKTRIEQNQEKYRKRKEKE